MCNVHVCSYVHRLYIDIPLYCTDTLKVNVEVK